MVLEKIVKILSKQLNVAEAKIKPDTNIATDLGADSLDLVEVLMSIEDEFGVSIPDEVIPEIHTVDDVVKYVEKNKK